MFFAEYWRRMYVDGKHSKQMVYDALESTRSSVNYSNEFYEAARRGAKMLKIEKYDGGRADPLNDMLYQGGLPMKLVTANITNSVWDRFTRGLVNRKINFIEFCFSILSSSAIYKLQTSWRMKFPFVYFRLWNCLKNRNFI